jgi:hypothetical protein
MCSAEPPASVPLLRSRCRFGIASFRHRRCAATVRRPRLLAAQRDDFYLGALQKMVDDLNTHTR